MSKKPIGCAHRRQAVQIENDKRVQRCTACGQVITGLHARLNGLPDRAPVAPGSILRPDPDGTASQPITRKKA